MCQTSVPAVNVRKFIEMPCEGMRRSYHDVVTSPHLHDFTPPQPPARPPPQPRFIRTVLYKQLLAEKPTCTKTCTPWLLSVCVKKRYAVRPTKGSIPWLLMDCVNPACIGRWNRIPQTQRRTAILLSLPMTSDTHCMDPMWLTCQTYIQTARVLSINLV